jgi:hypothetical protein
LERSFVALYFFHLRDGQDVLLDPDGRELPSQEAMVTATLQEARDIIAHDARQGQIKLGYRLDVEDAGGKLVHRLQFDDAVEIVRGAAND